MEKCLKLELKKWFSLEEASEIISDEICEKVTIQDILHYASNGIITICLNNANASKLIRITSFDCNDNESEEKGFFTPCLLGLPQKNCFELIDNGVCYVNSANSIFDLDGNIHNAVADFAKENEQRPYCAILVVPDEYSNYNRIDPRYLYLLLSKVEAVGEETSVNDVCILKKDILKFIDYCKDKRKSLSSTEQAEQSAAVQNALNTNEKNSMLLIIAALCKKAGIDPTQRGVSKRIEEELDTLGVSMTSETIKKYLDELPDLISIKKVRAT